MSSRCVSWERRGRTAEGVAVGFSIVGGPTLNLATEPRWARQQHTFGQDPETVTRLGEAFLTGVRGDGVGPGSVACVVEHFPGGGPQKDDEDAHFSYGREQLYSAGRFEDHLAPFRPAGVHGGRGGHALLRHARGPGA